MSRMRPKRTSGTAKTNEPAKTPRSARRLLCTGLKMEDLAGELASSEENRTSQHRCFVCRRQDGDMPLTIVDKGDGESSFADGRLQIEHVEREVDGLVFSFPLCLECAVLLNLA